MFHFLDSEQSMQERIGFKLIFFLILFYLCSQTFGYSKPELKVSCSYFSGRKSNAASIFEAQKLESKALFSPSSVDEINNSTLF
jgi:hypothetical protein